MSKPEPPRGGPPAGALVPTEKLNELAENVRKAAVEAATGKIACTLALAEAVQDLRKVVVGLVPRIRPLIGTALGFRTDRDKSDKLPPYSEDVIADCMIEAVARGLRWTGNEFNIIGAKCYTTKEGYTRLVLELPGLTDLDDTPGLPRMAEGGAVVPYKATWKLNGVSQSIERSIPVRLNSGMGADGALGKARRKLLAAIHGRVTGSVQSLADSDAEDVEGEAKESKTAALADKLGRTLGALGPAAPKESVPANTAKEPDKEVAKIPAARGSGPSGEHVAGVDEDPPPGSLFPTATGSPPGGH